MTEVNGLRLAYRGLVAGLAGGWVWVAVAAAGLLLAGADPFGLAGRATSLADADGAIVALALAQVAGGGTGLLFAYFFGRYFTVRATMAAAAPAFAVLAWLVTADLTGADTLLWTWQVVLLAAALAYGGILGGALPVRREVLRTA